MEAAGGLYVRTVTSYTLMVCLYNVADKFFGSVYVATMGERGLSPSATTPAWPPGR